MKSSTPTGDSAFKGFAEAEATATVHTLITRAAKPALAELEALRVALDVRCASLVATIAETGNRLFGTPVGAGHTPGNPCC